MDLEQARFLTGARGAELLLRARELRDAPAHARPALLGRHGTPEEARAALQQDDLRRRAAARCPHAERLLFTREALEQASAWPVAEERASRWPGATTDTLTDLTAGVGLDALATALSGRPVIAFEKDPVRALLLTHNVCALGLEARVRVRPEDATRSRHAGPLAFLDPGRRPGGRRTRDAAAFEPPLEAWPRLLEGFAAAMVKLPPASDGLVGETEPFEVVSLGARARERRRFLGAFPVPAPRRALCLPDGASVAGTALPWPHPRVVREGDWLLDPDPAVTLADLVGDLARELGLAPIHPRIAYLTGEAGGREAPGAWVAVEAVLPARPREVNAWLQAAGVGRVTLRLRGVAETAASWRKRLRPKGKRAGTVVFTRDLEDRWVALAGRDPPGR